MRANHRFVGPTRRQSVELSNLLLARSDDLVDAGDAIIKEVRDSLLLVERTIRYSKIQEIVHSHSLEGGSRAARLQVNPERLHAPVYEPRIGTAYDADGSNATADSNFPITPVERSNWGAHRHENVAGNGTLWRGVAL